MKNNILLNAFVLFQSLALTITLMFNGTVSAGQNECLNTFYADITKEFTIAYQAQGKPAVSFDNLAKVKDLGLSRLEARVSEWPKGATFSTSVLNDSIMVAVFCNDKQKKGYWKPAGY